MPPRISIKHEALPLQGYSHMLREAQRAQRDIVQFNLQKNVNQYQRPLERIDPGPSQHGGRWSTDPEANRRAARWFFANYPDGYQRTGQVNKQWAFIHRGDRLVLENRSEAASYLFSFARVLRPRGGRPNPGHITTGWPQEANRVARLVQAMFIDDVQTAWNRSVIASVAAGRYTIVVP